MSEDLYRTLMWLWETRPLKTMTTGSVFLNKQPGPYFGEPFTTRRKFLRGVCKRAGVRPFGFHALRRYAASILADQHKVSSKKIQELLRHKRLSTTEIYIQNIGEDLRAIVDKLEIELPQENTPKAKEASDDDR